MEQENPRERIEEVARKGPLEQGLKRVGDRIRELREAKAMTQKELAKQANIDQSYVSRVEAGYRPPRRILQDIARALATTPEELALNTLEYPEIFPESLLSRVDGPLVYCSNARCPRSVWVWPHKDKPYLFYLFKMPRPLPAGDTASREPKFCPYCGHPLQKGCRKCGLEILSSEHRFCPECGAQLFPEEKGGQEAYTMTRKEGRPVSFYFLKELERTRSGSTELDKAEQLKALTSAQPSRKLRFDLLKESK